MPARAWSRYDGFVAKFMGDGILAYFGFPHAHEDDAERAVRAGLEIASVVGTLKTRAADKLQVRIGIATGLVVVGDLEKVLPKSRPSSATRPISRRLQRHRFAEPSRAGEVDTPASRRRVRHYSPWRPESEGDCGRAVGLRGDRCTHCGKPVRSPRIRCHVQHGRPGSRIGTDVGALEAGESWKANWCCRRARPASASRALRAA
jgi:hypothetical protein